ncbi:MAG: hypothetical protein ACTHLV_00005, partial [Achromobacter mucicolens]
ALRALGWWFFGGPLPQRAPGRCPHTAPRLGRSSAEFELLLEKVGDDAGPYARGRNVLVWMDYVANTSAPWPPEVLAQMATQFTPAE